MRAHRPGRHSDDVLGPRALAAMADAARRSREAGAGADAQGPQLVQPGVGAVTPAETPPSVRTDDAVAADPSLLPPSDPPVRAPAPEPTPAPARPAPRRSAPSRPAPSRPAPAASTPAVSTPAVSTPAASTPAPPPTQRHDGPADTRRDHRPRSSTLIVSLSLMAVVAALLATWAVKGGGSGSLSSSGHHPGVATRTSPTAPPTAQSGLSPVAVSGVGGGTASPTTTAPPSTTTPAVPTTGSGPVLTTLEPASAAPGQVLVIVGSNLMSASGQITANFGTETSTVACPQTTSCLVMVPQDGTSGTSVPFTVTTDSGTSNALTFSYS